MYSVRKQEAASGACCSASLGRQQVSCQPRHVRNPAAVRKATGHHALDRVRRTTRLLLGNRIRVNVVPLGKHPGELRRDALVFSAGCDVVAFGLVVLLFCPVSKRQGMQRPTLGKELCNGQTKRRVAHRRVGGMACPLDSGAHYLFPPKVGVGFAEDGGDPTTRRLVRLDAGLLVHLQQVQSEIDAATLLVVVKQLRRAVVQHIHRLVILLLPNQAHHLGAQLLVELVSSGTTGDGTRRDIGHDGAMHPGDTAHPLWRRSWCESEFSMAQVR